MKLYAPFTPDQVVTLNIFQRVGVMHPFTCGRCRDNDEHYVNGKWVQVDEHALVATEAGWVCPTCDYTQDWAHDFMADREWIERNVEMLASLGFTVSEIGQSDG